MIEIIAIYLTSKNIAIIAQEKGYSKRFWRLITVLSWLICEFIGAIIGLKVIGQDGGLLLYAFALVGALLGVFIVRKVIDSKPDLIQKTDSFN